MIDTHTEEQAALYVLDLLEGRERADFEARLAVSVELRRLVRELSSALHAPLRNADGPARWDLLDSIQRQIEPVPAAPAQSPVVQPLPSRALSWSTIWGVAALLLLMMNLALLMVISNRSSVRGSDLLASGLSADGAVQTNGGIRPGDDEVRRLLEARVERLERRLQDRQSELEESLRLQDVLEDENREVRAFNAGWQREYMRLAARFRPFFESNDGMTRFTVIEMVDADAFDNQLPRRGFADLAGQFLAGGSNIAGTAPEGFVGPVAAGMETASTMGVTEGTGLQPMARSESGQRPGNSLDDAGEASPEPANSALPAGDEAMGFTVWRDDEQKGFLDIYNLPAAPAGTEPFLWVRSSDLEDYLPVGFLPELENGTGSVFYSVEEPNFTPTEIIITAEDASQPAASPSGSVLLRGP